MKNYFKSTDADFKNFSNYQFDTICNWLRTIDSKQTRILSYLRVNEQSSSKIAFQDNKQTILEEGEY